MLFFFFKQKTAYEMRISDWSSDVCSSDLDHGPEPRSERRNRDRPRRRFGRRAFRLGQLSPLHPAVFGRGAGTRQWCVRGSAGNSKGRHGLQDWTGVVSGKGGSVRVDLGGGGLIKIRTKQCTGECRHVIKSNKN